MGWGWERDRRVVCDWKEEIVLMAGSLHRGDDDVAKIQRCDVEINRELHKSVIHRYILPNIKLHKYRDSVTHIHTPSLKSITLTHCAFFPPLYLTP